MCARSVARELLPASVGVRVLGEMRDQPHMHQVQEGGATGCGGVGLSVERTESVNVRG
jgi:hypothetical protein